MIPKGERKGACANPCCNIMGANSPDMDTMPPKYYCQDCGKLANDASVRRGQMPQVTVNANKMR